MIRSFEELDNYLTVELTKTLGKRSVFNNLKQTALNKYDYPIDRSSDYFSTKIPFENADEQELFIFVDTIGNVCGKNKINYFFSEKEIELYSNIKYKPKKIKFPLVYSCMEVTEQQWIGTISAKELIRLRDAQLINYNENSQRTMKHIIRGNSEIWKISLNQQAVNQIMNLMQQGRFIPNTITLNLPQDSLYYYDQEKKELIIKEITQFDILDGYHRFIAISKATILDPDFDYVMEIRFACYPAGQDEYFTYQEDQKTHMSKMQSKALDPADLGNQICKTINSDTEFLLNNQLLRSGGLIDMSVMSDAIRYIYLDYTIAQKEQVKIRIKIAKEIKDKLNYMISDDMTLTEKSWSSMFIVAAVMCCNEFEKPKSKDVYKLIDNMKKEGVKFIPTQLTRRKINSMRKCIS